MRKYTIVTGDSLECQKKMNEYSKNYNIRVLKLSTMLSSAGKQEITILLIVGEGDNYMWDTFKDFI